MKTSVKYFGLDSDSQTVCCESFSGVLWNFLEFLKIINSYYN